MKRLLLLTALVVFLSPGSVLADKEEPVKEGTVKEKSASQQANFERDKARKVEDLKAKLACFEAAQTREAMKNCREQISKKHEAQEKQQRLQRIQEQKRKLEEQEKKIQGESAQ